MTCTEDDLYCHERGRLRGACYSRASAYQGSWPACVGSIAAYLSLSLRTRWPNSERLWQGSHTRTSNVSIIPGRTSAWCKGTAYRKFCPWDPCDPNTVHLVTVLVVGSTPPSSVSTQHMHTALWCIRYWRLSTSFTKTSTTWLRFIQVVKQYLTVLSEDLLEHTF